MSEEEIYEKAQEDAISHVVERIVDFISNEDNSGREDVISLPHEFSALESFLKTRFKKILDEQAAEYNAQLERLREQFEGQPKTLTREDVEQDLSNTSQVCGPVDSQELDKLIKERDGLRKLTDSLKSAVRQLSSYLHSCEDELNRTVVDELIRAAATPETPNKLSPGSSGQSLKRVHFAPDVSRILETTAEHHHDDTCGSDSSLWDTCCVSADVSLQLKQELETCLSKLRSEAAAILGLSLAPRTASPPADFTSVTTTHLRDIAMKLLREKESPSGEIMNMIEELTQEGDHLIEQLQHEKEDLQQQILAADRQLRSTRKFLEDEAAEREVERDEYLREVSHLQAQIKQIEDTTSKHRLNLEWSGFRQDVTTSVTTQPVEDLEQQVNDAANQLKDAETRKKELEAELKNTVEKVWVLTDIINKLESQIIVKSEREECLEKRLDELEAELQQQCLAQQAMVQEMESLKGKEETEESYMGQIAALQEEMKLQYSSNSIRNIKSELREIEKGLEIRTKELEGLNLTGSTTSLSSPSEEISIREQLDMMRSHTPEFCPSPVSLPVDEVNKLHDKIHRHMRAEEMIIKKVKDQDLQLKKLSQILRDVEAEREVLQQTVDKLNTQLGQANTKVDDLRRKVETAHSSANRNALNKISSLEENIDSLKQQSESAQTQLVEKEDQLKKAKELITSQHSKLRNLSQANPDVVNALRLELASVMAEKNKFEELLEKYRNENETLDMSPLYSCLLNDKNEDIQQLQKTVSYLQNQNVNTSRVGSDVCNSAVVGKTVSFVEALSPIVARDLTPLRDAPKMNSLSLPSMSEGVNKVGSHHATESGDNLSLQYDGSLSPINSLFYSNCIDIRSDNLEGEEKIFKLESEVKNLRSLVEDLSKAKKDVESYITSFTDDRKYYESQLIKLVEEKKSQEDEIDKLRLTLEKKDNEIKNTTSDVNKLQVILSNLQEKLKQASTLASKDNQLKKELSEMKEKCSTLEDVLQDFYKFREELGTLNEDFKYSENNTYNYFQNILETLRCKLRKSTDIELSNNNFKREVDRLKGSIMELNREKDYLKNDIDCKDSEISSLKCDIDEMTQNNLKLRNENLNAQQLKQNNIALITQIEKVELAKNLFEVELNNLKSENNKLAEELECIRTELKFKNINNNHYDVHHESDEVDAAVDVPQENENVADLEDLTYEIEKQLDLSAKLDNSLLTTLGDKPCCKKTNSTLSKEDDMMVGVTNKLSTNGTVGRSSDTAVATGRIGLVSRLADSSGRKGLMNRLTEEVDGWRTADSKQTHLTSQLNHLSRLVQNQDNRITRLLVELDDKKKECLVMELELMKERSSLKQLQCLLETERQRARAIEKEDTHLIETLRVRLECSLKEESNLKSLLMEEREKCETLEACLNSAKALESYVQQSNSDSDSADTLTAKNQMMLRIEMDQLKQMKRDLENVISRERNYQTSLKDKLKLVQIQNHSLENQSEDLKLKLTQEIKLREALENQLRLVDTKINFSQMKIEKEFGSKLTVENVLTEIKQWKDECLQLRDCIRLQREHEDYWSLNVQTPLIKQLNDVNRSLESLVREKITLQTYVNCLEKERDFFRSRVQKLEEVNEKPLRNDILHTPLNSEKLNLQSLFNKLQYLTELNHKMESDRKALIWQKRYLLVTVKGYQKCTVETIGRLDPSVVATTVPSRPRERKRVSFRTVVHVIRACIKLSYIHKRRKACRKIMVNKMKAEINIPTTPIRSIAFNPDEKRTGGEFLSSNNCMSLSPPSRDLYAYPRLDLIRSSSASQVPPSAINMDPQPSSKLSHYVALFDQMQKRLGKIIQNDNL